MSVLVFVASHLTLAVAGESVRIDDEQFSAEVATGAAQLAQGPLEVLCFGGAVGLAQVVNGGVGGDERQAVGEFKAFLTEATLLAQIGGT